MSERTTCNLTIQTMAGVPVVGESVTLEYESFERSATGEGVFQPRITNTTDATGLVQFENIHRLARYRLRVGSGGPWMRGRTEDAATTLLLNAMGAINI